MKQQFELIPEIQQEIKAATAKRKKVRSDWYADDIVGINTLKYPQFHHNSSYNPTINCRPLFNRGEFQQKFNNFKEQAQHLALAASLFPLRATLEKGQWLTLQNKITEALSEDMSAIFKQVERLYAVYLKELSFQIKQSSHSATNREEEIISLKEEYDRLQDSINKICEEKEQLKNESQKVVRWPSVASSSLADDHHLQDLCDDYKHQRKLLKIHSIKIAELELEKFYQSVQAQTFQSYINSSTVEQRIQAIQQKDKNAIPERDILELGLQQINLRIMDEQKLNHCSVAEKAYLTAHHGDHLCNLILPDRSIRDDRMESMPSKSTLDILNSSQADKLTSYFESVFTQKELHALDLAKKIVLQIEKNYFIADKILATSKLINQLNANPKNHTKHYLSIAAKIFAKIYNPNLKNRKRFSLNQTTEDTEAIASSQKKSRNNNNSTQDTAIRNIHLLYNIHYAEAKLQSSSLNNDSEVHGAEPKIKR